MHVGYRLTSLVTQLPSTDRNAVEQVSGAIRKTRGRCTFATRQPCDRLYVLLTVDRTLAHTSLVPDLDSAVHLGQE